MTQSSQFQPRQILCLEHGQNRLYAEVIQVVLDRPVCWLRPLILEVNPPDFDYEVASEEITIPETYSSQENYKKKHKRQLQPKNYDLRLSSDLLMPPALFRPAFDTELIPLLGQINSSEFSLAEAQTAHHLLRDLIQQVWQDHQELFPR